MRFQKHLQFFAATSCFVALFSCSKFVEKKFPESDKSNSASSSNSLNNEPDGKPELLNDESRLEEWKSDPSVVLDEKVLDSATLIPFKLRVPPDYKLQARKSYFAENLLFLGPARKTDNTFPSFMLSIIPKLPNQKKQDEIWVCLQSTLAGSKKQMTLGWSEGPLEAGKIDGVTFLRRNWSGMDYSKAEYSGYVYVGRVGDNLILVISRDKKEWARQSLKETEAAVLSLKFDSKSKVSD